MASNQSDSESTEQSPPPPSDSSSSSLPPPPSDGSSSPPPPSDSQSSPPPPSDSQSSSPPPSDDQSSPPPPSDNQSSHPSPSDSSAPPPSNQPPPSNNSSPSPPTSSNDGEKQDSAPASSSQGSSGSPKQGSSPSSDKKQLGGDSESSEKNKSGNKKSSKSSKGDSHGLSTESIARVAAGAALLLAVMVLLIVCCIKKRRKKKINAHHNSTRIDDNDYYNRATSPNMHGQPGDHFVNIPPPPGATNKPWMATPPSQPNLTSSDMSSSAFSGPHGPAMPPPHPSVALGFNKSTFTYEELLAATGGFSQDNLLGQGGFGYVHKGVLPNGKEVAVKSLKATSGQGDREFQAEVDIISRVHHRHLVSLVGYCISGEQRLLVYEFVPNKTLEHHLYGKDASAMDWPTRLKIAIGSARGLAYLHEDCHPRIIHRDIKAANILLETNFDAKVADFGLAKLNQDNYTHVSTRVMGTFGYLAPEYASSGKLTEKSDVFSFGVMLLELITGRPPVDQTGRFEDSLVDWARPLCARALDTGDYDELVDPRLEDEYNKEEMSCMVACAIASVRHSARRRPKMSQVVRTLEGDVSLDSLNEGLKPGGQTSAVYSSDSSEYDSSSYDADMKKFKKLALGTENFASSDQYGRTTGEYGHSGTSSESTMSRR